MWGEEHERDEKEMARMEGGGQGQRHHGIHALVRGEEEGGEEQHMDTTRWRAGEMPLNPQNSSDAVTA